MPRLRPPGLRVGVRTLLVLLACAAAVPFLLLSVLRGRERAAGARQAVEARALDVARLVAARIEDRTHGIRTLVGAATHAVGPEAPAAANDSLLLAMRGDVMASAAVTNLWLYGADGRLLGTSRRPRPRPDAVVVTDRPYFQEALRTGQPTVGDPVRSRPDGRWAVTFAQPMPGPGGSVRGVVLGTVHLASLERSITAVPLPAGAVVTLLDGRGRVLARQPAAPAWIGAPPPSGTRPTGTARAGAARAGEGLGEIVGTDGTRRLAADVPVAGVGWTVVVAVPSETAFAEIRREVRRDLLLGGCALLAALGLAAAIARRLVQPVQALAADAQAIAAGDFDHRSRTDLPGELGTLAAAFNAMAATVASRTAALHRSERRYRLLFEACPLPMYLVDLSTYRFLAVNDACVEQYGYTRDEFLGLTLLDVRPQEDRLKFLAVARALAKAQGVDGRTSAGVWRHVRKDGTPLDVEVFTAITEYDGQPARLSVAADVTARRHAERALRESQEQLRRAQKMEALGRFAGGIAHDFNNLLTGILGYCDLALADLGEDELVREDFLAIRDAARRAAGLTGQILAFSRGQVTQPVALDVNAVVAGVEGMLARVIGEDVHVRVERAPAVGAVLADRGQLEQVVMNLALNARDAMPGGGTLTLRTADVVVDDEDDPEHPGVPLGTWVRLEVADTGVGMDADTQSRIFEPFFTTKARGKGTGLGLATVYGIVRQAGGVVRVRSAPRQGATFAVYLPRTDEAAVEERRSAVPAAPVRGGHETVLLVEDEDTVRAIARESLLRRGYVVLVAHDGPSAIALARGYEAPIDLLLTDVVMPGMHGRELAAIIGADRPGMRVLFTSGYTEDDVLHRGVSTDAVAFIAKPFTPDALASRVRAVLDAGAAFAPALAATGGAGAA